MSILRQFSNVSVIGKGINGALCKDVIVVENTYNMYSLSDMLENNMQCTVHSISLKASVVLQPDS